MDKLKAWIALTAVGVLAVLAAGWFLLVSPKRSEAADLRQQASDQKQTNDESRNQLALLRSRAAQLPAEQAKLAAVAAKIPETPAQPELLRALVVAADGAGVELVSVTPGAVAPVAAAVTAPPATPPATTAPETTAGATPAPSAAVSGAGTLLAMPLTIVVAGGFFEVEQYLTALEDLPRALLVTGLTVAPGASPAQAPGSTPTSVDDGRNLLTTITGSVFVAAGASPAAPVVAPTPTPAG